MSISETYRLVRRTGCVYGTPEEVKAQLTGIAAYLGTKDPTELGAALLLEQAGYERSQLQLSLLAAEEGAGQTPHSLSPTSRKEHSTMRYEVRLYITLDANDQNEASRRASEVADAAADTEPALAAAANVACEDGPAELLDD